MSRSYRKTPITGITKCRSEKYDKRLCNRIRRSRTNQLIHQWAETDEDLILPDPDEVMSTWDMGKDGRYWQGSYEEYIKGWENRWFRWWKEDGPTKPDYYKDYYRWVLRK